MIVTGIVIVIILLSLILIIGYQSEADPEVVVSEKDYAEYPTSLPFQEAHGEIADAYSEEDVSIDLRDELIGKMKEQAEELGEDPQELFEAIKAVYGETHIQYLFSLSYTEYEDYLKEGSIAEELIDVFDDESYEVEENAELIVEDDEWTIVEDGKEKFRIERDRDELNIYHLDHDWEEDEPGLIPSYAEKCYLDGEKTWAIAFNRARALGCFNCYFVSIERLGTDEDPILEEFRCR